MKDKRDFEVWADDYGQARITANSQTFKTASLAVFSLVEKGKIFSGESIHFSLEFSGESIHYSLDNDAYLKITLTGLVYEICYFGNIKSSDFDFFKKIVNFPF